MKNLIKFIVRFHFFILFILIEFFSLFLVFFYNKKQKETFINSSNLISGFIYENTNKITSYLYLKDINKQLILENTIFHNNKINSSRSNFSEFTNIVDTIKFFQQYKYTNAKIINNSIQKQNNYITLNKGSKQGIERDMAVISPDGIIGIVKNVSNNFASVISVLNIQIGISAKIKNNNYFGSLVWEGKNYKIMNLEEIPNHVNISIGDTIITSGYSTIFPEGIIIGKISSFKKDKSKNFYHISVKLNNDFKHISHVYVIGNLLKAEQKKLEISENNGS